MPRRRSRKVALWLGHESIQTSEDYLRVDVTQRIGILDAATPPQLKPGRFRPLDKLIAAFTAYPQKAALQATALEVIFTCRLSWENGTFVPWDNRACLHYAFNDYDGYPREMLRTIVDGERPA